MFYHGIRRSPDKWSHRSDEWDRHLEDRDIPMRTQSEEYQDEEEDEPCQS